jgi:hypothetical protein
MWYESQLRWVTAIFIALGALLILLGTARLLYVQRRKYQSKDSTLAAFLRPSSLDVGLTAVQAQNVRRDVYRSSHRAWPWIFIGAGAGVILAGLAQFALDTLIYQRITELLNTSSDYIGLETVDAGIMSGLLFRGMAVGASIGVLLGVALTPPDSNRAQAPARGITDLVSPIVVALVSAPILAWLGFSIYCAASFPARQIATPLLETFPWLPYAGPASLASAFVFINVCAWIICRMKPRQWTHEESRAEWADRYCRTRLIAAPYFFMLVPAFVISSQFTTLGTLYPQAYNLMNPWLLFYSVIGLLLWIGALSLFTSASQSGRLGGRLTGWWWQQHATPQVTG